MVTRYINRFGAKLDTCQEHYAEQAQHYYGIERSEPAPADAVCRKCEERAKRSKWWALPIRPYDVIAAINRVGLATGSMRSAAIGADADYNGHFVQVYFNGYRGYWLAEYTWAGRQVLARGTFQDCLAAAKREYDRGALGASVTAYPDTPEQVEACKAAGFMPQLEADEQNASWVTWKHREVAHAVNMDRHGMPIIHLLLKADSPEHYKQLQDEERAARGVRS